MQGKFPYSTKIFVFFDFQLGKCQENSLLLQKSLCTLILSWENVRKIPHFFKNLCVLRFWVGKMSEKFPSSTQIFVRIFRVLKMSVKFQYSTKNLCIIRFWVVKMYGKFPSSTLMFVFWDFESGKWQ